MSNSSFQKLFNRRPATATIGLSIAAISFFTTILQGLTGVVAGANRFFFDFITTIDAGGTGLTFRQAAIGSIWSIVGLIACYRALEPRNAARFTVIVTTGVKLFVLLRTAAFTDLSLWVYSLSLIIAIAPIVLLLLPPSNRYYGRNQ
jgi:hypothetical protein